MIIEFYVQNHRSFKREQTLSLVASNYDKSLPENLFAAGPSLRDANLVKAAAIYGPNAGGKSNLLRALSFLKWLVVDSAGGQKPEAKLPTDPFKLDDDSVNEPTVLDLTFLVEGQRYNLAVAVDRTRILHERLTAYPSTHPQIWYDRAWDEESRKYHWLPEVPTDFALDYGIVEKTRENALFLSTAAQWNNAMVSPIYKWFAENLGFINLGPQSSFSIELTAKLIHEISEARDLVLQLLRSADLGLIDVESKEVSPDESQKEFLDKVTDLATKAGVSAEKLPENFWKLTFRHEGQKGKGFSLNSRHQSAGTLRYFSLLGPLLMLCRTKTVLCVDELDTSLHPSLVAEILRTLFKMSNQEQPSQLLFTTHNPLLLDMTLLRRDQIWFADKNQVGESFLYPLTDYKPRADESLIKGYLCGRYGAVPFIPHGLVGNNIENDPTPEVEHAG